MENKQYIYVCSPYGGNEENYKRALTYGRYVLNKGKVPVISHTMMHGIINDDLYEEREIGLQTGKDMMKLCSEVWVFGTSHSAGMNEEIQTANTFGIPVRYITDVFTINENADIISKIMRRYEYLFNNLPRIVCDDTVDYLNHGMSDRLILAAIETASRAAARQPWKYAVAILERCLNEGILNEQDFKNRNSALKPQSSDGVSYDLDAFEKMLNGD